MRLPQLETAPEQQEGTLHPSKQVKNWSAQHVCPKWVPGAHLPRQFSADQPRMDRVGPGSPNQDAASSLH